MFWRRFALYLLDLFIDEDLLGDRLVNCLLHLDLIGRVLLTNTNDLSLEFLHALILGLQVVNTAIVAFYCPFAFAGQFFCLFLYHSR